jgi:hypothetical protein
MYSIKHGIPIECKNELILLSYLLEAGVVQSM